MRLVLALMFFAPLIAMFAAKLGFTSIAPLIFALCAATMITHFVGEARKAKKVQIEA